MLTLLPLALSVASSPQDASPAVSDQAVARRHQVEQGLIPRPWVAGYAFDIEERMRQLNVPGASVAVLHEGRIDWAAGYGVRDRVSGEPVTTETLFQAGSISKPVAAMGAMRLAQDDVLDLNFPLNDFLKDWSIPAGGFDMEICATDIMSHTAGLSVHGFPGYGTFETVPSVVQVLDGAGPTNTDPVRRIEPVGQRVRYSGGGSTVLQLAMCDATGQDFATLLRERVLDPLGMSRSTYAQPLPTDRWPDHCAGHGWDGRPHPGRFYIHPEQFAAGLWTTASDVARFALELQGSLQGEDGKVLEARWGQEMLVPILGNAAQGLFIDEFGGEEWFGHGGSNQGFKNDFRASFEGGRGMVVLTNGDQGSQLADEIFRSIAQVYGWPGMVEAPAPSQDLSPEQRAPYVGRYSPGADELVEIAETGEGLTMRYLPGRIRTLVPLGHHRFLVFGSDQLVSFEDMTEQGAGSLSLSSGGVRGAARVTDPSFPIEQLVYGRVEAALSSYREIHGGDASASTVSAERLIELSASLWNGEHPQEGLAIAALCTELHPEDAGAWDTYAQLLARGGQREDAAEAYRRCRDLAPEDARSDASDRAWMVRNSEQMLRWLEGQ